MHFLLRLWNRRNQNDCSYLCPSFLWVVEMDCSFANPLTKSLRFQNKTCGKGNALFPCVVCILGVFHTLVQFLGKEYGQRVFLHWNQKSRLLFKTTAKWPDSHSFLEHPPFSAALYGLPALSCSWRQTRHQHWEHSFAVIFKCHSVDFILLLLFSNPPQYGQLMYKTSSPTVHPKQFIYSLKERML